MFLSKALSDAETRYFSTELEVASLVWIVEKLRHLIETSELPVIVFTDHSATVQIVQQSSLNTTSTVKLNLRHIRASEYLQQRFEEEHGAQKAGVLP